MVECNRDEEVRGGDGNRNRSFGFSTRCVPAAGKTPNKFYELEEFEKSGESEGRKNTTTYTAMAVYVLILNRGICTYC